MSTCLAGQQLFTPAGASESAQDARASHGASHSSCASARRGRKIVPTFVPILFQNAAKRLARGSKSRSRGIANKHAGLSHVKQLITAPHCLSLEAFLATVNRRVPGSSPGRGANSPFGFPICEFGLNCAQFSTIPRKQGPLQKALAPTSHSLQPVSNMKIPTRGYSGLGYVISPRRSSCL